MTNDDEVRDTVLRYFLEHPHAADSVEGIARWRLLDEFIENHVRQTAAVVFGLVRSGFLLEESGTGMETMYRLNRDRVADAWRFLGHFHAEKGRS